MMAWTMNEALSQPQAPSRTMVAMTSTLACHVGGRRPVGVGARQERLHRDHRDDRHREGQQQAVGFGQLRAAGAPDDDEEGAEQDRAEHAELRAEEFERLVRMQQRAAPVGVVGRVRERREACWL